MSKVRLFIVVLCALLWAEGSYAQNHRVLTLEQIFALADENSKTLKTEDASVAEAERNSIEVENKAKAERSAALDSEIADKQKKRDAIHKNTVDGILDSVDSMVGIGKTAALEKEYKQLSQEYDRLKKAFKPTIIKEVEKQT